MKNLITTIFTLFLTALASAFAQSATTPVWNKDGWIITVEYKNPAPKSGTVAEISTTVVYEVDGVEETSQSTENIELAVPVTKTRKKYTSLNQLNKVFRVSDAVGDGNVSFDADGKLVFYVEAVNDEKTHTFSFKIKPIASELAKNPVMRALMASVLKFE